MGKICGIYKITSPTGKVYIGQSVDIKRRRKTYKNYHCKGQVKLYHSLKKYGWSNHNFIILETSPQCNLNTLEKKYIAMYDSTSQEKGLNLTTGGDNYKLTKEVCDKIRNGLIGVRKSNSRSIYVGVSMNKDNSKWNARIHVGRNRIFLGMFDDEISAAYAYDMAVIKYYNGLKPMNFTDKQRSDLKSKVKKRSVVFTTSKHTGVSLDSNSNRWSSSIWINSKARHLGTYATEEKAAMIYDSFVINNKLPHSLNIPDKRHISKNLVPSIKKPASRYNGVTLKKRGLRRSWEVNINIDKKRIYIGMSKNEHEAAQAYNNYVIKHKLNRRLNIIKDIQQ